MAATMQPVKVAAVGLAALAALAVPIAYGISAADQYQPRNALGLTASGSVVLAGITYIGAPLIVFFGTPFFMFLWNRGRANWWRALGLGAAPAVLVAPFIWQFAILFLPFGLAVAVVVRLVCGPGPNNSSKPTPLRGAA